MKLSDGEKLMLVMLCEVYAVPVHGFETAACAYAANAIGVSCSARTAAGGLKPCRSMSHSAL